MSAENISADMLAKPSEADLVKKLALLRSTNCPYKWYDFFGEPEPTGTEAKLKALRKTNCPYEWYSAFGDPEDVAPSGSLELWTETTPQVAKNSLSKKDFQDGCRRIFRQYVPPAEGHQLRPHYRDFIVRNEQRSPEERFRLFDELSKYDISTSGSFKPHFNREQELLTISKLLQIEKLALNQPK